MSTTRLSASSIPYVRLGRWLAGKSGSLYASWSSASLSFLFTGSKLSLSIGSNTERKDKANGGTHMIAVLAGATEEAALLKPENWRTFDPEPSSLITFFDGTLRQEKTYVRIMLIDWASTFELDAFIIDDKKLEILVVGDSISSCLAVPVEEGGEPVPFGILNAFHSVAQRVLREDPSYDLKVDLELVAYPGYNLVHPTEGERGDGYRNGMEEAFFWDSPWSKERLIGVPTFSPIAVLIELGTNDQFFGFSKDRFGAALVNLVQSLKKWHQDSIRYVWLVPPFPDSDTENRELNDSMPSYVTLLESKFGDGIAFKVCDLAEGLTTANTVDGVHPPLAVHNDLGRKLAAFIASNLTTAN
ncbi:hypothetical protein CPB84DRAFT_1775764 [Gymnopilus junonius]|uniref:SGNH hydrolase-type esterase domain-containing protein n=1 Tax=Gymnopilus junonius TaxID=109634 RepID=A0A9P5NQ68_GYMJU|nr:hypothetical protein CPB84DRAFT_1775764 [Gymnopilus junonius]